MPNTRPFPTTGNITKYLFLRHAEVHGRKPTFRQVAEAMSSAHDYVQKIYHDNIPNPGRTALLELATYFGATPLVFFPELWDLYCPELWDDYYRLMDGQA